MARSAFNRTGQHLPPTADRSRPTVEGSRHKIGLPTSSVKSLALHRYNETPFQNCGSITMVLVQREKGVGQDGGEPNLTSRVSLRREA
jgi:hypothetical protein